MPDPEFAIWSNHLTPEGNMTDKQRKPGSKNIKDLNSRPVEANDADNVRGGSTSSLLKTTDIKGESTSKGHTTTIEISS